MDNFRLDLKNPVVILSRIGWEVYDVNLYLRGSHVHSLLWGSHVSHCLRGSHVNHCLRGSHVNPCLRGSHVNLWFSYQPMAQKFQLPTESWIFILKNDWCLMWSQAFSDKNNECLLQIGNWESVTVETGHCSGKIVREKETTLKGVGRGETSCIGFDLPKKELSQVHVWGWHTDLSVE